MKFYRIYIEITNVCGLSCSFCPTKDMPNKHMELEKFESIVKQAKEYTDEIACHVLGDPLTLSSLSDYLDVLSKYNMKALLTTSGYFLKKHLNSTLFHQSVKQINISVNSFNKNETSITFEQYIEPVLKLAKNKVALEVDSFINLRVWNLDESLSERGFNSMLFDRLSKEFNVDLDEDNIYRSRPKSIRLASKVLLHFDNYFEWPSLNNDNYGDGTCQGLKSHIAVLADGRVVPCCLDCDGIMELGNLNSSSLKDILSSQRVENMLSGFKVGEAREELCQKCSYKERFN